MNNVDIRDHLSHMYEFDGGWWRDRKWWVPIFKELFKSSCDQGYVTYRRVWELAEEKRIADEKKVAEEEARAHADKTRAEQEAARVLAGIAGGCSVQR